MPIHIRRFHIRKINDLHKKHNEEHRKAMETSNRTAQNIPKMPNIPKNLKP